MQNNRYYNIYEEYGLKYYQLPKVFFTNEKYKNMSNDAKIAWALLKDRFELSVKNGWYDESGNIYFIYTNEDLKEILNVGNNKLSKIKKELQENDLLEQKRIGQGKPNRLYIKKPIITDSDIYPIETGENINEEQKERHEIKNKDNQEYKNKKHTSNPCGSNEVSKRDFKKSQKEISRNPKRRFLEIPKEDANDTNVNDININNTNVNKTNLNLELNQMNEYIWKMKLPMPLKKFFADKVEVLVNDKTFNIFEIEYFYNTYTNYIRPDCTRDDKWYLNDLEYTKTMIKMYEEVERPIKNMEGLIKSWVQWAIHYKIENYNENIELDDFLER